MECSVENRKQVKLDSVVNAAILDMYEDQGRYYHRASFMASRGLKKLYTEALPKIKHKAWIPVNRNTFTATLPLDFESETWVGFVDERWRKVPLKLNNKITDRTNIIDVPCESACPKCNQDTSICNDLVVTEENELVVINDTTYTKTTIKKLYPNGDYYLETTTPVVDIDDDSQIDYVVKKEFITNFDLKPCGCLDTTPLNTSNLQTYCPQIWCDYYAPCETQCCTNYGGYRIFEESGLIQMDSSYPYDKVYIEYNGYISKINGQYYVPMVSFETLVEWTKWKLIQNRKNYPLRERQWQFDNYVRERNNMMKVLGRISLSQIIQSIAMLPKFDIDYSNDWYGCFGNSPTTQAIIDDCTTTNSSGQCCIGNTTTVINRTSFILSVKTGDGEGHPIDGLSTYQNNVLIGALDLKWFLLAKQPFTLLDGDFTFDSSTGTIDISPNRFFTPDSLIVPYNKNL